MPVQIQKVSITHDAIIDVLVARPDLSQRQLAAMFGYTPTGIGIIVRSDAFKARLQARKDELVDPLIKQSIEDRFADLAHASLDILQEKLATSADPKLALAALDAAQKGLGFGARNTAVINNNNFVVPLPGPAASSSEWSAKFAPRVVQVEPAALEAPVDAEVKQS